MRTLICGSLLVALALLSGCGQPGAPRSPSLQLPLPVSDLKAVRKGDTVTITWTVPTRTNDDDKLRSLGGTRICRIVTTLAEAMKPAAPGGPACSKPLAEIPANGLNTTVIDLKGVPQQQASFKESLLPELIGADSEKVARYSIEVANERGRSAGVSNSDSVSLVSSPTPQNFAAIMTPNGPQLSWKFSGQLVDAVVNRLESSGKSVRIHPVIITNSKNRETFWLDPTFEWEKRYRYSVADIVDVPQDALRFESEGSESIEVITHDTFPPAVPSGPQAVFSEVNGEHGIDLTWNANSDADLAGYNVYRRQAGGEGWSKINTDLIKTPIYRDAGALQANSSYEYAVSALDVRANESAKSPIATERVP